MARPPSTGVGFLCQRSSLGTAIHPSRLAARATRGVRTTPITNDKAGHRRWGGNCRILSGSPFNEGEYSQQPQRSRQKPWVPFPLDKHQKRDDRLISSILLLTSCNIRIFLVFMCLAAWVGAFSERPTLVGKLQTV